MPALAPDPGLVFGDVCVICQDDVTDRGRLDGCAHLFCVPCIVRWAEIETKCPLCKARFKVIYPEAYGEQAETKVSDAREGDGAAPERTRGSTRRRAPRREPIRVVRRDQMYEDPDGDPLNGLDLDEVTCGTCGEGGDEDRLMLCDGCDAGHHCYCVGLETVPLEEWRCRICAGAGEDPAGAETNENARSESGGNARTVATVRAQITHETDDSPENAEEIPVSPRHEARRVARRRAASLRAARFSSRMVQTYGQIESRVSSDARARSSVGLNEGVAVSFENTPSFGREPRFDSRSGPLRSRSGSGADTDARRSQVARVRELRLMWERYRAGEIAFDGNFSAGTTTARTNEVRETDRPSRSSPSADNRGSPNAKEESVAEMRRRAAAATLAAVGWSGGGGEAALANAPGRVFSGSSPYERLVSETGGGAPPETGGRLLKRARRREPLLSATSVSRASDEIRREDEDEDEDEKNAKTRRLPAALALGASRGGSSMSGSGPDRKGAFAGVTFSPPRRDAVQDEASGWTSSDEDEADARTRKDPAANPKALSPRRKEKAFLATRANRFVPPGSVTHVPPAVSARDAEATRRAMLRDAEAAGAPDKARVIQMVKARLKPYWAGSTGADRGSFGSTSGNKSNIRTAEQFKRLAKSASASARAATAVAALKHGPDASADGTREEAIARAVQRAVDAALTREGIEVRRG